VLLYIGIMEQNFSVVLLFLAAATDMVSIVGPNGTIMLRIIYG
jgi:hypothetical protein